MCFVASSDFAALMQRDGFLSGVIDASDHAEAVYVFAYPP
jgi:hypothetical protein